VRIAHESFEGLEVIDDGVVDEFLREVDELGAASERLDGGEALRPRGETVFSEETHQPADIIIHAGKQGPAPSV
jgi:hypothetical protein